MLRTCVATSIALLLLVGTTVCADISTAPWSQPSPRDESRLSAEDVAPQIALDRSLPVAAFPGLPAETAQDQAKPLPPAPDSALLFLCGLGSAGMLQLGRSARKLHFADLPEWYHTGAPAQIGYSVPLDLNRINILSPCLLDPPVNPQPVLSYLHHEPLQRFDALCLIITSIPRGPPLLSC